jgi:hypothetical protein
MFIYCLELRGAIESPILITRTIWANNTILTSSILYKLGEQQRHYVSTPNIYCVKHHVTKNVMGCYIVSGRVATTCSPDLVKVSDLLAYLGLKGLTIRRAISRFAALALLKVSLFFPLPRAVYKFNPHILYSKILLTFCFSFERDIL